VNSLRKGGFFNVFGLSTVLAASLFLHTPDANAVSTVLDFENIYAWPSAAYGQLPTNYGGFTWSQHSWWLTDYWAPSAVIGNVGLYNRQWGVITAYSAHHFMLESAYITPVFSNMNILAQGWLNGDLVYSQTISTSVGSSNFFTFNFTGIDTFGFQMITPGYFIVDNITTIPNPEPSSLVLLGSGLAGLGWWRRKRARSC
jgi:hypothetical protein